MNYKKNTNYDLSDDDDINNYDNDTYSPVKNNNDYSENMFENDRQYNSESDDDKYNKRSKKYKVWDSNNSCLFDSFVFKMLILSNIFMEIYSSNHKIYFSEPNLIYFTFSLITLAFPFVNNCIRGFTTDSNKFFYMYGVYLCWKWWSFNFV